MSGMAVAYMTSPAVWGSLADITADTRSTQLHWQTLLWNIRISACPGRLRVPRSFHVGRHQYRSSSGNSASVAGPSNDPPIIRCFRRHLDGGTITSASGGRAITCRHPANGWRNPRLLQGTVAVGALALLVHAYDHAGTVCLASLRYVSNIFKHRLRRLAQTTGARRSRWTTRYQNRRLEEKGIAASL